MNYINCCLYPVEEESKVTREEYVLQDCKTDIVKYCESLTNVSFYGVDREDNQLHCEEKENYENEVNFSWQLGALLKLLHFLINKNHTEEEIQKSKVDIMQCLHIIAEKRKSYTETTDICYKKLLQQFNDVFLKFYTKAPALALEAVPASYWGHQHQLLAGKIIADNITDMKLDPIFGVLLCPYAGTRDTSLVPSQEDSYDLEQNFWFEYDNNTKTFHAIVYDAFKYLKENHNIGPGCNYLADYSLFHPDPLPGQTASLLFWKRLFDRINEEEIDLDIKMI